MHEKLENLIRSLEKKTEKGEATWSKTSRINEFVLKLDIGSISTDNFRAVDDEGNDFMVVEVVLRNKDGEIIYNLSYDRTRQPVEYADLLKFHSLVRACYYKVDETIDTMLKELGKDGSIGRQESPEDRLPF